ncbi:Dyp-type peroxidase [Cellulomonas sp. HZM]|uniref:Dyp-type peroxidase n=1 Tax=Cellulomonas sp. HZM TaxID=1454010 RepID=UPI0004936857|nr:Dyp-type peroxidase [Cellulomonas sp. HZM]
MSDTPGISRRALLLGTGGVVAAAAVAAVGTAVTQGGPTTSTTTDRAPGVRATGRTQAGVARPATPQRQALHAVLRLGGGADPGPDLRSGLAAAGATILRLVSGPSDELPDGPGDLTIHVGLGPGPLAAIDPTLPAATAMPRFAGDDGIPAGRDDGDVLVALASSDGTALRPALDAVVASLPGATTLWAEHGFRGPGQGTIARNPLGYHDGIIVPEGDDELDENVWLAHGPLAGATVCVLRRLRLDRTRFAALAEGERDRVIGRHADGRPLSGGGPTAEVDLQAKTPEGAYLTPARSHARAAHPSFTGSALMLRRGYAFDRGPLADGTADAGLLFVCFAHDLETFVRTQLRLDETDDLMPFTTPTASGSFLVLPGFDAAHPLGHQLWA